jgi:CDP-diacylglycerol---serine O-phosphatidyltransferase
MLIKNSFMKLKSQIPNLITLLNLFSGCVALVFAFKEQFFYSFCFVCLGIFFDFFDGFFARLLKVSSPLGLQLDSLADMVTSGVVPGVVMYFLLRNLQYDIDTFSWIPFLGFFITLGACYRLAKFNIDTRQTDSFLGLPTPANALFILSLPMIIQNNLGTKLVKILCTNWVLILIIVLSVIVMNSEIPLFALKFKKMTFKDNFLPIVFLIISALLLFFFQFLGIAIVIVFYVLLSVFNNFFIKKSFES